MQQGSCQRQRPSPHLSTVPFLSVFSRLESFVRHFLTGSALIAEDYAYRGMKLESPLDANAEFVSGRYAGYELTLSPILPSVIEMLVNNDTHRLILNARGVCQDGDVFNRKYVDWNDTKCDGPEDAVETANRLH